MGGLIVLDDQLLQAKEEWRLTVNVSIVSTTGVNIYTALYHLCAFSAGLLSSASTEASFSSKLLNSTVLIEQYKQFQSKVDLPTLLSLASFSSKLLNSIALMELYKQFPSKVDLPTLLSLASFSLKLLNSIALMGTV